MSHAHIYIYIEKKKKNTCTTLKRWFLRVSNLSSLISGQCSVSIPTKNMRKPQAGVRIKLSCKKHKIFKKQKSIPEERKVFMISYMKDLIIIQTLS